MKKFNFRLKSLLRYKEHLEQEARQALAVARQAVKACEDRIAENLDQHARMADSLENQAVAGIDAERYRIYCDYLTAMEAAIDAEKSRREDLLSVVAEKQQDLNRKSMEKKMLDNLKDKKRTQFYEDVRKAQQQEIDEMVILRRRES